MRQDDGEGDVDQEDGEAVNNGRVERGDSGQQEEKCFAIYEHPGGLRSEMADQPCKEKYKCDGIGESNDGKDCHGKMCHRGDGSSGEKGHRGEGSNGEKGNKGEGSSVGGEMMMGRENVRLKLALVECRLLLHDQVIKRDSNHYDNDDCHWSSESEDVF